MSSGSPPPPKRARVELPLDEPSSVVSALYRWLADADVPHVTLSFLNMGEMCEFRATCSAAKDAVASYRGAFEIVTCTPHTSDKWGEPCAVSHVNRWRRCFPSATNVGIEDFDVLTDADVALLSGAVRSLSFGATAGPSDDLLTAAALPHLAGLEDLAVGQPGLWGDFTPSMLAPLAPSLKQLCVLHMTKEVAAQWCDLPAQLFSSLHTLQLLGNVALTPAMLASLPALRDVFSLCFPSPDCWPAMGRIESLTVRPYERNFGDNPFTTAALRHLRCLKSLRLNHVFDGTIIRAHKITASKGYDADDFSCLQAIESLDVDARFLSIDDGAACHLQKATGRKHLRLVGPHRLSSDGLGRLQSLEDLTLDRCDLEIDEIPPLPRLKRLCVSRSLAELDTSLEAMAPSLVELSLTSCACVTTASLACMANLRSLSIRYCHGIDVSQLPALVAKSLPQLRTLTLTWEGRLSEAEKDELCSELQGCDFTLQPPCTGQPGLVLSAGAACVHRATWRRCIWV